MKTLSPLAKGIITGILMIIVAAIPLFAKNTGNSNLIYLVHALFGGGIVWTLLDYRRSASFTGKFKDLFGQGFRCFVIATLLFVLFIGIYTADPSRKEQGAVLYREQLVKERTLPNEIDERVAAYKKHYTTAIVSTYIFGYLILGAIVTAGCSALLMRRNQ